MTIRFAAKSDVGKVREGNEDSYLVREPMFVVADGMGGHLAGDVASQMAVDVITEDMDSGAAHGDRDSLVNAVKHANSAIYEKGRSDNNLSGMGTTLTLVFVADGEARLAHVGDSRAYLLRDGELKQLTDDHTLVNRMVKEGRLRAEDAERHPQRSVITRALGVDANVKVDYRTLKLSTGDRLLLNSDGLTSMVDQETIQRVLEETSDPEETAEKLVQLANEAGGEDNITVVIIDFAASGNGAVGATAKSSTRGPVKIDTSAPPGTEPVRLVRPPRRWPKKLFAWLVALVLLSVGGYFTAIYLLDQAWFVGTNEDGFVAIYQGIPEDIAGLDLKDEIETSQIAVADLPQFLRANVREGIKVDSEEEARSQLADLRARARALRQEERQSDRQQRKGDKSNTDRQKRSES